MIEANEEPFQLEVDEEAGWTILRLSGELDAHAAASFDRVINDVTTTDTAKMVVDMGGVSFVDSSGLRSLVRARARVGGKESLLLRAPRPATVRLLEITGLLDEFTIG